MPIHRPPGLLLPIALTAACACLIAAVGPCDLATMAHPPGGPLATGYARREHAARVAHAPDVTATVPPADSEAVRRAADLVRRARDVERSATTALDPALADSARRSYLAAAALVPDVADWLRVRAAGVTRDPGERAALLRTLTVPPARERAPLVDALVRARTGDVAGASATLDSLGRPAQALGVRLQTASDANARRALRDRLFGLLSGVGAGTGGPVTLSAGAPDSTSLPASGSPASGSPAPDSPARSTAGIAELPRERARVAAVLLDSTFGGGDAGEPLTPTERVRIAHVLADARDQPTLRRAAAAFAAARTAPNSPVTSPDLFAEAGVLAHLGQWRDAAAAYARVQGAPAPLGRAAAYERGHALLRAGDGAGARSALRALADAPAPPGGDPDSAVTAARFLLAELTADDGRDAAARIEYLRVAREQPLSRWAVVARFRAGVIAFAAGDVRAAAADFDSIRAGGRDTTPDANAVAGAYWAGRAWAAAGDTAQARARWELALARDPASYYAWRAATRLRRPWMPTAPGPGGSTPLPIDPSAESAGRRAALLERVGLTPEAGYEREYVIRRAGDAPDQLLAVAHALATGPRPGPGIRLAARAVERGAARTPAVWQLLDPLFYGPALRRTAAAAGVDPALAAGVIRQESNFTADALSPVGARGLMQLMPDVGRALWRGEGGSTWSPDLLFVPDVNLALGMRHLAAGLRGYSDPTYALAAYNAGGARVTRWRRQPGADDPELFVERIPYAETRDYVRIVLRNRELYRALYRL